MSSFKNILLAGLAGLTVAISSCAYENEEELFGVNPCRPEITTYSDVIRPIININCALANCHDGSNGSLPDFTVFENVQSEAFLIKERTGNRSMPPSSSGQVLTSNEIDDIACWVDSGAQNN